MKREVILNRLYLSINCIKFNCSALELPMSKKSSTSVTKIELFVHHIRTPDISTGKWAAAAEK